jgi:transcriptional regulator with XRE-family HTH domain
MVISTSTHSALLNRENRRGVWGELADVMILRTFEDGTHNAPNVAQYTAQPQPVSNIVHKDSLQRASVLQHVSQNVRRLRHAADMSQTTLAEKSGVSRRMLVAIEAGEKNVSLTTLDRVAEALEVAFSDLIQAPDNRDPSRINELAWAGSIPGSKAVLLSKAAATREVEQWEWCLQPGEVYPSQADAEGWSEHRGLPDPDARRPAAAHRRRGVFHVRQ